MEKNTVKLKVVVNKGFYVFEQKHIWSEVDSNGVLTILGGNTKKIYDRTTLAYFNSNDWVRVIPPRLKIQDSDKV